MQFRQDEIRCEEVSLFLEEMLENLAGFLVVGVTPIRDREER
jgi:hypothetical protein